MLKFVVSQKQKEQKVESTKMDEEKQDDDDNNDIDQQEEDVAIIKDDEDCLPMIPISNLARITNFVDRYFVRYYIVQRNNEKNLDQYAFQHTNKLIIIGVSKQHDIIKKNIPIKSISFDCIYKGDFKSLVSGKKKKGGLNLSPDRELCTVTLENNEVYIINGGLGGNIMELNENLLKNPNWLLEYPESKGFIAIIHPSKKLKLPTDKIITYEQYKNLFAQFVKLVK